MKQVVALVLFALTAGTALACPDGKTADAATPAYGEKAAAARAPAATPVPSQSVAKVKSTKPATNSATATATSKKPSTGG
jgi:hypothetical protein